MGDQGKPFSWGNATFGPNFYDPDGRRSGDFTSSMIAWQQQASPRFNYRVSYQNLVTGRDTRNGPGGVSFQPRFNNSSVFDGQIDTLQGRADFAPVRWNLFGVGYEFEREWYGNYSTDQNPDPAQRVGATANAAQRSNAFFFQNQTRMLNEKLQLHLSGRYQSFDLSKPTVHRRGAKLRGSGVRFAVHRSNRRRLTQLLHSQILHEVARPRR